MRILNFSVIVIIFLFSQLSFSAPVPLDDQKVVDWILISIDKENEVGANESILSGNIALGKVEKGWARLKACRDAGNSLDLHLAAAEHYMYARYLSSDDGDTNYRKLPKWYETIKKMATEKGLEDYLKTSDQPLSQTDGRVTAWGNKGVEAGLLDYEKRKGKKPTSKFYAYLRAVSFASLGYYSIVYKYPNPDMSCDIRQPKPSAPTFFLR